MTHSYMSNTVGRLAAVLLALAGAAAHAEEPAGVQASEPRGRIVQTARDFLRQQLEGHSGRTEIAVGTLDSRLDLPRCDRALQGYLPPGAQLIGHVSVGVRCDGSHPWRLYVSARVSLTEEVLVAKEFIPRGTQLAADQFDVVERDVTGAPQGYLTDPDQAVGLLTRQPVRAGAVLSPAMLKKPTLIHRGDQVDIVSRVGAMEVRMKGSALGDGCEGDRIKVRNSHSRRIVEGLVNEDGLVVVQM